MNCTLGRVAEFPITMVDLPPDAVWRHQRLISANSDNYVYGRTGVFRL
jgi:hypothetical protein